MLELAGKAGTIMFSNNEIQQRALCLTVQHHLRGFLLTSCFACTEWDFWGVLLSMSINMDTASSKAVQVRINGHPILRVSFNALPLDCLKADTESPWGISIFMLLQHSPKGALQQQNPEKCPNSPGHGGDDIPLAFSLSETFLGYYQFHG